MENWSALKCEQLWIICKHSFHLEFIFVFFYSLLIIRTPSLSLSFSHPPFLYFSPSLSFSSIFKYKKPTTRYNRKMNKLKWPSNANETWRKVKKTSHRLMLNSSGKVFHVHYLFSFINRNCSFRSCVLYRSAILSIFSFADNLIWWYNWNRFSSQLKTLFW